jgi:transcriptional regulator with GAF, ATPase, and Fis domain
MLNGAFLLIRNGPQAGQQFPLDFNRMMHIGRGRGCEVLLTDPVSSRFHAVVYFEDDAWHVRDTESRNGTLVNGSRTDHASLADLNVIQVGTTELEFRKTPSGDELESTHTQTLVMDRTVASSANACQQRLALLNRAGQLQNLYELSVRLMSCRTTDEAVDAASEALSKCTGASLVGLLWLRSGRLEPERILPRDATAAVRIGKKLTDRVVREGKAIWIKDQTAGPGGETWADAICVPLKANQDTAGALHLYRESQRFTETDFELAVEVGSLLSKAVDSVRRQAALQADNTRLASRNADFQEIIGKSAAIERLKAKITRVGPAVGCVLIRGESGVGKELVARAVQQASPRASRPMLSVNCAAIPRDLIESQLFGHKKGSFTGADSDHVGFFQQAHTGTLFLDEIGELPLDGQAKLLRILEGHPFLPVGATREERVDVRVVAATNRDLAEFVREKRFREDLFYRLSVFELLVPPLRDRGEDIALLMDHFLDHFRKMHGRSALELSTAARRRLLEYNWPGNVRQLRNVIDSAIVMADGDMIEPQDLGLRDTGGGMSDSLRLEDWEKRLIAEAMDRSSGNVGEAAELLGISRATAYRKLKEYGVCRDE